MTPVESVVQAVLYEGYMLYPYRPSSVKNRQRWTFGGVYPQAWSQASGSDPWLMQSEFLIRGDARTRMDVRPGFLQVIDRIVLEAPLASQGDEPVSAAQLAREVPRLDIDDRRFYPWQEAAERHIRIPEIALGELLAAPREISFSFDAAAISRPSPIGSARYAARCGARTAGLRGGLNWPRRGWPKACIA